MNKAIEDNLLKEALRIIAAAEGAGVPLRLLGGLAVRLTSPSTTRIPALMRPYADIDFVGLGRDGRRIKEIFLQPGYAADERFNALHGRTRLIFHNLDTGKHIDIFLDRFEMCHTLDLRQRLFPGYRVLSLADLLVTKLQIVQLNAKDMQDILALLLDHRVGAGEEREAIDTAYLAKLTASDWGLYTTLSDNLEKTAQAVPGFLGAEEGGAVVLRIANIQSALQAAPKTARWHLRAKIGRRMEWYDLPDEVNR